MIATNPDRRRLQEMVQFAAAYRGWSTKQLAEALQRDPRSLVPESGTPKVDLIIRLADALDWPVGDLIDHLSEPAPRGCARPRASRSRAALRPSRCAYGFGNDRERLDGVREFLITGDLDAAIELGDELTTSTDETIRAQASLLLAVALDRRGRPMRALGTLQSAARSTPPTAELHVQILAQLADAYHRTGQPTEARAIASEAISRGAKIVASISTSTSRRVAGRTSIGASDRSRCVAATPPLRFAIGLAHAVHGACLRDAVLDRTASTETANDALAALDQAADALSELAGPDAAGLAMIVDAGRAAMAACAGKRRFEDALTEAINRLDPAIDPTLIADRRLLIGLGWWCVLVGAAAVGRLDEDRLHRTLAILTNKADELAAVADCWALRERVLTLEHDRRRHLAAFAGHTEPWLLDHEDLRMVIGCMGASRRFRPLGLEILREAVLLSEPDG